MKLFNRWFILISRVKNKLRPINIVADALHIK